MLFIAAVVLSVGFYTIGYRSGKSRVKQVIFNWMRYRIVESGHNRLDRLCLPLLDNLKQRIQDL